MTYNLANFSHDLPENFNCPEYKNVINEEIRRQIEELIKLDEQNKGVYEFKSMSDNFNFSVISVLASIGCLLLLNI